MKRVEYLCNICDEVVATPDGTVKSPFVGFEFERDRRPFSFRIRGKADANRHICDSCLAAFVELAKLVKTTGMEGS